MARPIKETPVLRGDDAKNFIENTKNVVKETEEAKERIIENYNALSDIAKF
nr:hypothetical protein [uncultured Allomuricauda sp.]